MSKSKKTSLKIRPNSPSPSEADIQKVLDAATAIGQGVGGRPSTPQTATPEPRATRRKAAAGTPRERLTLKLPPELVDEIKAFCARERASVSYGAEVILRAGLGAIESLPDPDQ